MMLARADLKVHWAASLLPMRPQHEIEALAESIRANGLRFPIVLNEAGEILDGRNRLAACKLAGAEPAFRTFQGDDEAQKRFVLDMSDHRTITAGQRAVQIAMVYPEAKRGGVRKAGSSPEPGLGFSKQRLSDARAIVRHSRDLAHQVLSGTTHFEPALRIAEAAKRQAESDEGMKERLAEQAPDLAQLVAEERMTLAEAIKLLDNREAELIRRQKSATSVLHSMMFTLFPRGATPKEWAAKLLEDVRGQHWPKAEEAACSLSAESIASCAAVLTAMFEQFVEKSDGR